jgi:hypothetical protein
MITFDKKRGWIITGDPKPSKDKPVDKKNKEHK